MKRTRLILALLATGVAGIGSALAAGGAGGAFLPKNLKPPTADVTTDAQLNAKRAAAGAKIEPVPGKAAAKGYDLIELSSFIADGEKFTLVPINSVIFVPEARAANIIAAPGKDFINWQSFLLSRRAWVTTFEVTLAQARGEVAITPEQIEKFKKGTSIIVATYRGGPISVLPHNAAAPGAPDVATGKPARP